MRTVLAFLLAAFLAPSAAARGPSAQSTCPFTSLDTQSFGAGTGVCADSVLTAALEVDRCAIDFAFAAEPVACGNVFLTQTFLLAAPDPLASPVPLPAPFVPGSRLFVAPTRVFGPFRGATASLLVPPDAALLGQSLTFQSVPFFFSTIPHPGQTDLGASTGLRVTLR